MTSCHQIKRAKREFWNLTPLVLNESLQSKPRKVFYLHDIHVSIVLLLFFRSACMPPSLYVVSQATLSCRRCAVPTRRFSLELGGRALWAITHRELLSPAPDSSASLWKITPVQKLSFRKWWSGTNTLTLLPFLWVLLSLLCSRREDLFPDGKASGCGCK